MALSEQHAAYSDCFDKLDEALEQLNAGKRGIRCLFKTWNEAKLFQQRACKARVLDRRQNARLHPKDDVRHGTSAYDLLLIRNPRPTAEADGMFWVYLERQIQVSIDVEPLEDDTYELPAYQPTAQSDDFNETTTPDRTPDPSPEPRTGPEGRDEQPEASSGDIGRPQKILRRV